MPNRVVCLDNFINVDSSSLNNLQAPNISPQHSSWPVITVHILVNAHKMITEANVGVSSDIVETKTTNKEVPSNSLLETGYVGEIWCSCSQQKMGFSWVSSR